MPMVGVFSQNMTSPGDGSALVLDPDIMERDANYVSNVSCFSEFSIGVFSICKEIITILTKCFLSESSSSTYSQHD